MIRINIYGKSQKFIGKLRERAAAACQLILLKFIIRFPASKVSTINPDIGSKPTK